MIDMERKIGEIFEFGGEWYQCLKGISCKECDFSGNNITCDIHGTITCTRKGRSDDTSVVFKKLDKIGESYTLESKKFQKYRVFHTPYIYNKIDCSWQSFADPYYIGLEVKQNKEEVMYIYKVTMNTGDRDYLLDKLESILHDTHCQQYKDEIREAFSKYISTESVSDLKPFDLKAAKAGKPVCTRDGRNTRIVCFDKADERPIVALISDSGSEFVYEYLIDGRCYKSKDDDNDLMMLPEKKSGWMNVYEERIYDTKQGAIKAKYDGANYIDTIKISWEE